MKKNYIFESCVSINGEYIIFQDEVFSLKEQKTLGNIWSSMDLFKNIFESVNIDNKEYKVIKESILSIPLMENKTNLFELRDILLEFDFMQDTWLGKEFGKSVKGVKDFASKSYEGLKKFGVAVSQGQWTDIINLLGKGVKYIFRSLKSALFSTGGMIVDSMLIAMGIGKVAQFIPWAMVFGLDIYQWINNDYEEETSTFMKVLDISFDIIGMISSGVVAQGARRLFGPIKSLGNNEKAIVKVVSETPAMKSYITTALNGIKKVPGYIRQAIAFLGSKFPKGASFLKSIMGGLSSVLSKITNVLERLVGKTLTKGLKAGTKMTGVLYGFHKGIEGVTNAMNPSSELSNVQKNNMNTLKDVLAQQGNNNFF